MLVETMFGHDFVDEIGARFKGEVLRLDKSIIAVEENVLDLQKLELERIMGQIDEVDDTYSHDCWIVGLLG
jgi:hypothetical protein